MQMRRSERALAASLAVTLLCVVASHPSSAREAGGCPQLSAAESVRHLADVARGSSQAALHAFLQAQLLAARSDPRLRRALECLQDRELSRARAGVVGPALRPRQ